MSYFAEYLYVAQVFQVVDAGDVEYVVFLQRDVGLAAVYDGADVYLLHFAGLVLTLAVQYGTAGKGVCHQSVGFLYQFAYGVQLAAQLVDARTVYGAAHFQLVGEAVQNGFGGDYVAVVQLAYAVVGVIHGVYLIFLTVLAHDAQALGIGVAGKSAGIFQQGRKGFAFLHFVAHGAFHVACNLYQFFVGRNDDHVAFFQADVVAGLALHDELVDVYRSYGLSAARYFHVTEATDAAHTACTVEGVEYGREGREGVGSRLYHFAHHVDLDGAAVAQRNAYLVALVGIDLAELAGEVLLCALDAHAAQEYRTELFEVDGSVGRDLLADGVLAGSPDVDYHFIARTETVVGRGGYVDVRFERKVAGIEDVAAEYGVLLCHFLCLWLFVEHGGIVFLCLLAQACFGFGGSGHVAGSGTCLLFVHFLYAFRLFAGHTAACQLGSYGTLVFALFYSIFSIFQHLLVGHARLRHEQGRTCHKNNK